MVVLESMVFPSDSIILRSLSLLLSAMLIQLVWMRYWFEEEIKFMMDNSSSGSVLLDPDDSGILTFHLACCVDGGVSVI